MNLVFNRKLSGIAIMIFAMFIMTVMDAAVKWLVSDYSIQQINFFSSIVAMIVLLPQVYIDGGRSAFKMSNFRGSKSDDFIMISGLRHVIG